MAPSSEATRLLVVTAQLEVIEGAYRRESETYLKLMGEYPRERAWREMHRATALMARRCRFLLNTANGVSNIDSDDDKERWHDA